MTKMACPYTVITEKVVVQILFNCTAYLWFHTAAQDEELKWLRRKITHYSPYLNLVKVNAYANFDQIPLIRSQASEQKQNFDNNQGIITLL